MRLGPHKRIVKINGTNVCVSHTRKKYFISWCKKQTNFLFCSVKGDDARPSVASFNIDCVKKVTKTASLVQAVLVDATVFDDRFFTWHNCFYRNTNSSQLTGSLMLELKRAYYPLRTKTNVLWDLVYLAIKDFF